MASNSYPRLGYNGGQVVDHEYEALTLGYMPDGIVGAPTDSAVVYADNTGITRNVKIRANKAAHVRGVHWFNDDTEITLSLAENLSSSNRIDLVVLRLDRTTFEVTEEIVTGTPGAGAPALTQDVGDLTTGVYEFPLAQVTVTPGASSILASRVVTVGWYVSPNGIACTTASRPYGHTRTSGLRIWDNTVGSLMVWDGTAWAYVLDETSGKGVRDVYRLADNSVVASGISGLRTLYNATTTNRIENGRLYDVRVRIAVLGNTDLMSFRAKISINGQLKYESGYVTLWRAGFPYYWAGEVGTVQASNGALAVKVEIEAPVGAAEVRAYSTLPFEVKTVDVGEALSGIIHT